MHIAALAGLLLWFRHASPVANAPGTEGAVELVMLEHQGPATPTTTQQAAITPHAAPSAEPRPEDESEPLPPPMPSSDEPAKPSALPPSRAQRTQEAPRISLTGTDSETNAVVLDSPQVIPASIDTKFRNREPVYPPDAARRAEQGVVILLIHVSPQGLTAGVDVLQSSGFLSLDRSARDAVWGWHFLPAMRDGRPIPFDMALRVVFQLE
jgi:protein TonB